MSILGTLGAVGAGVSAAGSLGSASIQSNAAKNAQSIEQQQQQQALAFEKGQYDTTQAQEQPFIQAGQGAVNNLSNLLKVPGQGLLTPWTQQFQAPTIEDAEQMPGYKFALQQGEQALQNSAAARGGLLSSGTAKNLNNYAQNAAQTDYQNVYNNSQQQYQEAYNAFQQNQQNTYGRLSGLAGIGQQAVGTAAQSGLGTAGQISNLALQGGQQQAQQVNNAAAAQGAGVAGATNAATTGLSNLSELLAYQNPNNGSGYSSNGYGNLGALTNPSSTTGGAALNQNLLNQIQQNPNGPFLQY